MHRYDELERKYYKHKIKEIFIYSSIISIVMIFIYLVYHFINQEDEKKENNTIIKTEKKFEEKKNEVIKKPANDTIIPMKDKIEKVKKELEKEMLLTKNEKNETNNTKLPIAKELNKTKPTISIPKSIEIKPEEKPKEVIIKTYPVYHNKTIPIIVLKYKIKLPEQKKPNIVHKKEYNKSIHKEKKIVPKTTNKEKVNESPKKSIDIEESNLDVKNLLSSFDINPSYDKAIEISEYYLSQGNLEKARNWALTANDLDPLEPKSWILFAKIFIKKGKKKEALKVLENYIKEYGENEKIRKLIRSLK